MFPSFIVLIKFKAVCGDDLCSTTETCQTCAADCCSKFKQEQRGREQEYVSNFLTRSEGSQCILWGESNFLTFFNGITTFRAFGEYVFADLHTLNLDIEVQVRLVPTTASSTAVSAVCFFLLFRFHS
jgi:hypothetical protein